MMRSSGRQKMIIDEEQQKTMLKIGDVAKTSGVGIETLRFYEKSGLLEKPPRTFSGYRMYSPEVLDRLAFIKQAQALGFSLDDIRRVIEDARTGQSPCEEVREIVRRRLAEVEQRIEELKRYRKEISETLEEWDKLGQAPGHICGLIEHTHIEHAIRAEDKLGQKNRR